MEPDGLAVNVIETVAGDRVVLIELVVVVVVLVVLFVLV
jgi:hypothetical protein